MALYLFVFSIPFEMPQRTIPVEIPTLTGAMFLLTTVLQPSVCFRRLPAAFLWFVAYLWAFGLVVLINRVSYTTLVLQLFVWMVQVILLFWVGTNLMRSDRVVRGILLTLIIACTIRAALQIFGIAVMTQDVYTGGARVTMFGQNTNLTSMILAAGMAAVVGLQLNTSARLPRMGILTWPLAALMGFAIIQSGSRGGLLSAALGLTVFALRGSSIRQRVRNGLFALVALVLLGWGAYQTDVMRNRFEVAAVQGQLAGREEIYPALADMFIEQPIFGWGPIANQFEIARRIEDTEHERRDAHNLVGELLTSGGLFIAIPFLIGMGLCIRAAWRARHGALELVPLAILVAVLAGMVSGTWIAGKIVWLALSIALAAGMFWSEPAQHPTPRHEMAGV
jgi:O-antigen ligase